jgi:hypothetical protein
MTNFNDAKITSLFVSQTASPGLQDDAPNAPSAGSPFNVTLEMEAGTGLLSGAYTVTMSCEDITAVQAVPSLVPTIPAFTSGTFGQTPLGAPGWTSNNTFTATVPVTPEPATEANHTFQYTATLVNVNGQVTSFLQSDLFVLI